MCVCTESPSPAYYSTLKAEASFSSETLAHIYQITLRYSSQDIGLHSHAAKEVIIK
jgi:hypothetical protein